METFPDIGIPKSITENKFYTIEEEDIKSDEELSQLIKLMYDERNSMFEYYFRGDNAFISKAIREGRISANTIETSYYKRPNSEQDYVQIMKGSDTYEWQEEIVEKQPMFFRRVLTLTEREIKSIDREKDLAYARATRTWTERITSHPYFLIFEIAAGAASLVGLILYFL